MSAANKSGKLEAERARPWPERPVSAANKSGKLEAERAGPWPERPVSAANKSGKLEAERAGPWPERPVSAANKSGKLEAERAVTHSRGTLELAAGFPPTVWSDLREAAWNLCSMWWVSATPSSM